MRLKTTADSVRVLSFLRSSFKILASKNDVGVMMCHTNFGVAQQMKKLILECKYKSVMQSWLLDEKGLTGLQRRTGMAQMLNREFSFMFSKTSKPFKDSDCIPRKFVGIGNTTAYPDVRDTPLMLSSALDKVTPADRVRLFDTLNNTPTEWQEEIDKEDNSDDDSENLIPQTIDMNDPNSDKVVAWWLTNHPLVLKEWLHQLGNPAVIDFSPGNGEFGIVCREANCRYVSVAMNAFHAQWLYDKWVKNISTIVEAKQEVKQSLEEMLPTELARARNTKRKLEDENKAAAAKKTNSSNDATSTCTATPTSSDWFQKLPTAVQASLDLKQQGNTAQATVLPPKAGTPAVESAMGRLNQWAHAAKAKAKANATPAASSKVDDNGDT